MKNTSLRMAEVNIFTLIMKSYGLNLIDIDPEKETSEEELEKNVKECFSAMERAFFSILTYNPTGDMISGMKADVPVIVSAYSRINEDLSYFSLQSGNDELSYSIAKRAADFNSNCGNKEAYAGYVLGNWLLELEDYESASRYLNRSLDLEANNPYACILLGRSYHQLGEIGYAEKEFNNALDCDLEDCEIEQPKDIDFLRHFYAAMFYHMIDDQENAVRLFEKCIKMKPNDEKLYARTILCYQILDNHEEAIRCARYGMMNCEDAKGLKNLEDISLRLIKKNS